MRPQDTLFRNVESIPATTSVGAARALMRATAGARAAGMVSDRDLSVLEEDHLLGIATTTDPLELVGRGPVGRP